MFRGPTSILLKFQDARTAAHTVNSRQDHFYKEARRLGYHCRSAFKLQQLDRKFKIFSKHGDLKCKNVVDLGCSPGSWCQVIRERVPSDCMVVGVDLHNPQGTVPGAVYIKGDFTEKSTQRKILEALGASPGEEGRKEGDTSPLSLGTNVDVVVSDMSPNRTQMVGSGHQQKAGLLNMAALEFSLKYLRPDGNFICKVLGSNASYADLERVAKERFGAVSYFKPEACRDGSSESYMVCQKKLLQPRFKEIGGYSERYGLDDWPGSLKSEQRQLVTSGRRNQELQRQRSGEQRSSPNYRF